MQAAAYWLEAQWDPHGPRLPPRQASSSWAPDVTRLVERIVSGQLRPEHLPAPPWNLHGSVWITGNNAGWLGRLRAEIAAGPAGSHRARTGIVEKELRALAEVLRAQERRRYGF